VRRSDQDQRAPQVHDLRPFPEGEVGKQPARFYFSFGPKQICRQAGGWVEATTTVEIWGAHRRRVQVRRYKAPGPGRTFGTLAAGRRHQTMARDHRSLGKPRNGASYYNGAVVWQERAPPTGSQERSTGRRSAADVWRQAGLGPPATPTSFGGKKPVDPGQNVDGLGDGDKGEAAGARRRAVLRSQLSRRDDPDPVRDSDR